MNDSVETLEFQQETAPEDSSPDKGLLQCVLDDFHAAEIARSDHEGDWERYFKKYMCHLESTDKWNNRIFDPETFSMVETVYPRLLNTIAGTPEVFGVKPTAQDDVANAQVTESLLNYQADRMDLYSRGGDGFKDAIIYGTAHWKIYWKREFEPRWVKKERIEIVPDPATGMPTPKLIAKKFKEFAIVYDDPCLERLDIYDVYVDPLATCVEDARFMIHRVFRSRDYLKKKEMEGEYFDIKSVPKGIKDFDDKASGTKAVAKKAQRSTVEYHDEKMEDVELLEYHGKYDMDGDGLLEEVIVTVANRAVVIGRKYNEFPGGHKPFLKLCTIPIPGSYYGMSAILPIDTLQDSLNERINQIGDNIDLSIHGMFKVLKWADIDDDQLVPRPAGIVEVNQMGDIEKLEFPTVFQHAYPEIQRLEGKIQKATGAFDVVRGQMPTRQETATTTVAMQNMGEIRFKTMAMHVDRQFIRPLGNTMIRLNEAYMPDQKKFRILGNDFMLQQQQQFAVMSRDQLATNVDIYAVGAALEVGASKEMRLQKILQAIQILTNPMFQQNPLQSVDIWAAVEQIPYLMDLKLKRPLIVQGNPMLAYQQMMMDQQLANQMMANEMSAGMPPGATAMGMMGGGQEMPSRTKGELAKRDGDGNREESDE